MRREDEGEEIGEDGETYKVCWLYYNNTYIIIIIRMKYNLFNKIEYYQLFF
jgi:hypothetical protein